MTIGPIVPYVATLICSALAAKGVIEANDVETVQPLIETALGALGTVASILISRYEAKRRKDENDKQ